MASTTTRTDSRRNRGGYAARHEAAHAATDARIAAGLAPHWLAPPARSECARWQCPSAWRLITTAE